MEFVQNCVCETRFQGFAYTHPDSHCPFVHANYGDEKAHHRSLIGF